MRARADFYDRIGEGSWDGIRAYGQPKLGNVLLTYERRLVRPLPAHERAGWDPTVPAQMLQ